MTKREKIILFISRFIAGIFCFFIPKLINSGSAVFARNENYYAGLDIIDYVLRTVCFLIGTLVIMYSFSVFSEKNK